VVSPPSFREFLATLTSTWFTRMSGPLSVPLTIAAIYVESAAAKTLLGITAFVCFWAASYAIWSRERAERNKSQRRAQEAEAKSKGYLEFARCIRHEGEAGRYFGYAIVRNASVAGKLNNCRCEVVELSDAANEVVKRNIGLAVRGQQGERFGLDQGSEKEIPIFEVDQSKFIVYLLAATEKIPLAYNNYIARVHGYGDTGESDEIKVQLDIRSSEFFRLVA
jgi:hypothetical protein